jgi:hypothetical protein
MNVSTGALRVSVGLWSWGVKLFQEAAEREAATADLARRVLRFLLRARYDQGLRFSAS